MKIAIMADEVSSDLDSAMELIKMWGVNAVELRNIGGRRFPDVSDYYKSRVPMLLKEYQLEVSAISPGMYKIWYPDPPGPIYHSRPGDAREFKAQREAEAVLDHHVNYLLPLSIEWAQRLNCKTINCFGFQRQDTGPLPEGAVQVLRYSAEKAAAAGLQLVVEIEDRCHLTADLIRRVNHPAIGINWDAGNGFRAGDDVPYPDAYEHVRPYLRHVHFKDSRDSPKPVRMLIDGLSDPTGKREWTLEGVIDWKGAIAAMKRDGYDGYITVEPHVRPQASAVKYMLDKLRRILAET